MAKYMLDSSNHIDIWQVSPAEYKRDIQKLTRVLIMSKHSTNNRTKEFGLV